MPSNRLQQSFLITYILAFAFQLPIWMCGGLLWGAMMIALTGAPPWNALRGGFVWGLLMQASIGNLLAGLFAWRRSTVIPVEDRPAFRAALDRACAKVRCIFLDESQDEIVLGPKRARVRFQFQEIYIDFEGREAKLTAPAVSFWAIRKELKRQLAKAPAENP